VTIGVVLSKVAGDGAETSRLASRAREVSSEGSLPSWVSLKVAAGDGWLPAVTGPLVEIGVCGAGWASVWPGVVLGRLGGQVVLVEFHQVVCRGD
jgi:hypothetical protein